MSLNIQQHKVLLIGANPSQVSKTNNAFDLSTKSGKKIIEWICKTNTLNLPVSLANVYSGKTINNKPPTKEIIRTHSIMLKMRLDMEKPTKIVAFGKIAANALNGMGYEFFEMPHPSGCNRKLNDKEYVAEKIKGLTEFLSKP